MIIVKLNNISVVLIVILLVTLLAACGGGQQAASTPCNNTAKAVAASVSVLSTGNGIFIVLGTDIDGVSGIQLDLNYDTSMLTSPTVTQGGLVSGSIFAANTSIPGLVKIAAITTNPFLGSGTIATISFATQSGSGVITLVTSSIIDGAGTVIPSSVTIIGVPYPQQTSTTGTVNSPQSPSVAPPTQQTSCP